MMPTFATKVTDSVCKWVSGSIVLLTSALRKRAVTQKLDLDQMSERSIGILKDTYIWLHSLSVANFGFIRFAYIK